ncbi:MAG: Maf family protein [Bacilli bacterium]
MKKVILGSGSPRRKEMLSQMGVDFKVVAYNGEEPLEGATPEECVTKLAILKASGVYEQFPDALVIGSDTVVVLGECILGKPMNDQDAMEMLKSLSGKTHRVLTSVAIIESGAIETCLGEAEVTFFELTEEEIRAYLETNEHTDKAGSYGIQGHGAYFVKEIKGDYTAIVGLPYSQTARLLQAKGVATTYQR